MPTAAEYGVSVSMARDRHYSIYNISLAGPQSTKARSGSVRPRRWVFTELAWAWNICENDPDLAVSGYVVVPRLELAGVSNSVTRTMSVRAEPRLQFSRSDDGCIS